MEVLILTIYFGILIGLAVVIYKWATKLISLKKEHNDLLREISKKIEIGIRKL